MPNAELRLQHYVRPLATVHDRDTGLSYVEIEFLRTDGEWVQALISRSKLNRPNEILGNLLDMGAAISTADPIPPGHIRRVLGATPAGEYSVTSRTGWVGDSFVLPDITIGPASAKLRFRPADGNVSPGGQTAGTLASWRAALRKPCASSSYITFAVALAFAAPLLRLLSLSEGGIFYLVGESGTGKTLVELVAESVTGPVSRERLLTHDVTSRRLEEEAARRNDLLLVLDEIGRMAGGNREIRRTVRELAHKLTGGGGRRRSDFATKSRELENLDWRLMSMWSGERTLEDLCGDVARERGEQVRLIEILVPPETADGILDRLDLTGPPARQLAADLEQAVVANYGHAIRDFIERVVADRDRIAQRAAKLLERFIRKVCSDGTTWDRRFAAKFGLAYAAARIAAELNIAPWPRTFPYKVIAKLYRNARTRVATPEEAANELLRRLATHQSSARRFPIFKKGASNRPELAKNTWGLRYKTRDGIRVLAIQSDRLNRLVRPPERAEAVRSLLAKSRLIVRGKEGRGVHQIKIDGFGSARKPYFVLIRRDRLRHTSRGG